MKSFKMNLEEALASDRIPFLHAKYYEYAALPWLIRLMWKLVPHVLAGNFGVDDATTKLIIGFNFNSIISILLLKIHFPNTSTTSDMYAMRPMATANPGLILSIIRGLRSIPIFHISDDSSSHCIEYGPHDG